MLDAMPRLWELSSATAGSPAILVVAGATTPRTPAVRSAVDRLDPTHRARVLFRDDVDEAEKWAWYRECAVMAAPSRVDSLGLCYLEAWACGKPVIAARTGPQSELVTEGSDGCLVAPGDAAELASAIAAVLSDAPRASAMGERGRERVSTHHTWDHVVGRMRAVYAQLARGAGA